MPGTTRNIARNLAAILQDAQLIGEADIEAALVRQRETGRRIGETLVELGVVTEEDIGWALAKQFGLPFVDVPLEALDRDLILGFREGLLFSLEAVPLVRAGRSLSVAVADPTDGAVLEALEEAAGCPVHTSVATRTAVRDALTAVLGPPKDLHPHHGPTTGQRFDVQWDRSGATFLLFHVTRALGEGGRGIQFVTGPESCRVFYRTATGQIEGTPEPVEVMELLLARLATLGGPTLASDDRHVTGRALCPRGDHDVLLDVSLLRHDTGVSATLGLERWSERRLALEDLGLRGIDLARIRAMLDLPSGLTLVSGPPRSGVSTTLAAMTLASRGGRTLAFEGRAGGRVPASSRVTLDPAQAREHWPAIAAAQDADMVVLDDVLTGDTVEQALCGAGAGRHVLAGTDWTDTFALLEALTARPAMRSTLAARLQLVVQQRLVTPATTHPGETGSPMAVFEVLHVTDAMRVLLRDGDPSRRMRDLALADGMRPLEEQLDEWLETGAIDARERHRARG